MGRLSLDQMSSPTLRKRIGFGSDICAARDDDWQRGKREFYRQALVGRRRLNSAGGVEALPIGGNKLPAKITVDDTTPACVGEEVNKLTLVARNSTPAGVGEEVNKLTVAVRNSTPACAGEKVNEPTLGGVGNDTTPAGVGEKVNRSTLEAVRVDTTPAVSGEKVNRCHNPVVDKSNFTVAGKKRIRMTGSAGESCAAQDKLKTNGKRKYTKKTGKKSLIPGQRKLNEFSFTKNKDTTSDPCPMEANRVVKTSDDLDQDKE